MTQIGQEQSPVPDDSLPNIGAPATRALEAIGVTGLRQVTRYRSDELLALHGFGPRALRILCEALKERKLHLADD